MFSRTFEYAVQAVMYIVIHGNENNPVRLNRIAESQQIPIHFLSKILQRLVRVGLLHSCKGPSGGFVFLADHNKITLYDILAEIDGEEFFDRCGIGLRSCLDSNPCPIHHEYKEIKNRVKNLLSKKTLAEVSSEVEEGKSFVTFVKK